MKKYKQHSKSTESGYALITTIMFSAVIVMIAVSFSATSKRYIHSTIAVNEQAKLRLKATSVKEELIYNLLTKNSRISLSNNVAAELPYKNANFHGTPFKFEDPEIDIRVSLQDCNGLVGLFPMNAFLLEAVIEQKFGKDKALLIRDSLRDWTDKDSFESEYGSESEHESGLMPRNNPLQSFAELKLINGVTDEIYDYLFEYFSPTVNNFFNPLNAPNEVLRAFLADDLVEAVNSKRENGELTASAFSEITGMKEKMWLKFSPGSQLLIKLHLKGTSTQYSESVAIDLLPYIPLPYVIVSKNAVLP